MAEIEEKIRDFGQKGDIEALETYLEEITSVELVNLVQSKVCNASFVYTWDYILKGFTESSNSHKKRFEVVMKVVKELEKRDVSIQHCNAIIHRLCMELVKFKAIHLVPLCNFCLECLESQRVTQMSWKELMPELLNVISEKQCVENNDVEMSGLEYKHQMINAVCMLQWPPDIVTALTTMFIDMSLTKEEHFQIVNKLGSYLEKLTPQEIPPFIYQLLRLCKETNSGVVFTKLQQYFGIRIYENPSFQNLESPDIEAIETGNDQDIVEAESTVLFHIHSSASLGHECIKTYLSSLKNVLKSPEFVLHPFQLGVLFTISTISYYEERVFEIVRSCVSKYYHEEQKKISSAWFREMVPITTKIESIFSQIINLSAQDRDLVLQGLVSFAFLLLGVGSGLGRDIIAEKQWQLGNMILFKIIKRKRHTAPIIIQQLSNRVFSGTSITQYIECLYMLSKNLTLLMLENKSVVVSLMEGLVQMPGNNARMLLDALIPLIKVSPTIRDHFILLLRKALYSRSPETRQVAVVGYLKLLTNLKISNLAALSQSSFSGSYSSGHSLFTQISINRSSQCAPSAFSNEALCLEVLSILRRCFMQQAEVRARLYEGLYGTVCLNPELGVPVLEMIWLHFNELYVIDDETLPPLKFDKITLTKDVNVSLQEPLAKLIYTMGLITTTVAKLDNENPTVIKFSKVLDSLCTRMISCELVHFDLDDGTDILDIMPESQQKLFILKEAMSVYEALIGYKFFSWEKDAENHAKQINGLFTGYNRLINFASNLTKPKKLDSKKKKDVNKTTQNTIDDTMLKKDAHKKSFKIPDTTLDFQVINKILRVLYEPVVPWTTVTEANIIKPKRDFHQHIMQAILNLLSSIKSKKIIEDNCAKLTYGYLCDIASVLYERIIKKLDEIIEFDCATAVLAVDCFLVILNIVNNHYRSNIKSFLSKVGGHDKQEELLVHLTVQTYQKLFEIDEEEVSADPEIRKLSLLVINTLHFFVHQIPTSNNTLALQMMEWLKNVATTKKDMNKHVVTAFVNLLFDCHIKFKVSLALFESISISLGNVTGVINEEELETEEFSIITEQSANNVFVSLCNNLKAVLEDIDWTIARLKAEFTYLDKSGSERRNEHLKNKEKGVCVQLCFVISILTNLSNCTVPPGNLSEAILKNLILLYITLSDLSKYFILRSSKANPIFQAARFERVVKLAGKQLSPVIYKFITYIEESQKPETEATQNKNKRKNVDTSTMKNKVLKETRLIPKAIYEIEQFSKFVIQLSNKTKIDLSKLVGQGTVRDFRIKHLKEVLEQAKDVNVTNTQDSDTAEEDSSLMEENDNEETSPPSAKKTKT